jgi:hypothetical protein
MSLKIDTNQSAIAHHVFDGAVVFPYAIDAHMAVANHPLEWSETPWSSEDTARSRKLLGERGVPLPEEVEMSEEDRAALDQYNADVAAAKERLEVSRKERAERLAEEAQIAADEALVNSPPPRPDPTIRRPFGRKGEPTPAELEQIRKREAKKEEDERIAREKKNVDTTGTL